MEKYNLRKEKFWNKQIQARGIFMFVYNKSPKNTREKAHNLLTKKKLTA